MNLFQSWMFCLWFSISSVTSLSCAHQRQANVLGASAVVTQVKFRGVHRFKDDELLPYLNLRETSRILWWNPKFYYQPGLLAVDKQRIKEVYRAFGYYHTKVVGAEVNFRNKGKHAHIEYLIEEGEPLRVSDIEYDWPEGPPKRPQGEPPDLRAQPVRIQEACTIVERDVFEVEKINQTVADLQTTLQSRGYPFAEVNDDVFIDREKNLAKIKFTVVPGPFARIRRIEIEGLDHIPKKPVLRQAELALGKPYSPKLIEKLENRVYGLQVFRSVVVRVQPSASSEVIDHQVDLVIHVRETDLQAIKLGGGLGIDPNRWDQHLSGHYSHRNLFGNLTHFTVRAEAGYAELPALYDPQEHGPIGRIQPSLKKQGLLEKGLIWTLSPVLELGLQRGYQYYSFENRVGVTRFFTRFVEVALGHSLRFVDFFSAVPALVRDNSILGRDFRDPYVLSYITLGTTFRLTDQMQSPRNGVVLDLKYDLAGGYLGGQFDFHRLKPDLRAYWQVHKRLQLAARAQVGMIFLFGDQPGTPIDLKYYLGGADSLRGWGYRTLAPYVEDCDGTQCGRVPVGGRTQVLSSFELRVNVWQDLYAVAFFDVGDVQPETLEIRPGQWNYTTGPGVRYDSKIGKLRLDVGFRLNRDPRFMFLPIWALHFGLGEAF